MKKQIVFSAAMMLTLLLASCGHTKVQKIQDATQNVGSQQQQEETMNDTDKSMEKMDKDEEGMMKKDNEEMVKDDKTMETNDESIMMEEKETMMKDDKNNDSMMEKSGDWAEDAMDKNEETMVKEEVMMKKDEEVMVKKAGAYANYDSSLVGSTEDTVIFFHANWCPSCRAADKGISAGTVPVGLTILKADFDSETDLRKKYGVVAQHTFVQVDANGNEIKKWIGGTTVGDIVDNI